MKPKNARRKRTKAEAKIARDKCRAANAAPLMILSDEERAELECLHASETCDASQSAA
jgi:hypothetical protein